MSLLAGKIYNEVFTFCERKGLIKQLKESFKNLEPERFAERNIAKKGLDILDAVHCIYDKNRSMIFLEELDKAAVKEKQVIEAGIGTGILSFLAAAKGGKVTGVELNPKTLELANEIKQYLINKKLIQEKNIKFILCNATKYIPKEQVDIIISENIYTGMFYEKQVQIMNHLIKFLKKEGKVIPLSLKSFLFLGQTTFPHTPKNKEEFAPEKIKTHTKQLAQEIEYDSLNFNKKNQLGLKNRITTPIINNGEINSLTIYSVVLMPSGKKIERFDTTFFNGDIILAIKPSIKVKKGDKVKLYFSYKYGMKPMDAVINLVMSNCRG